MSQYIENILPWGQRVIITGLGLTKDSKKHPRIYAPLPEEITFAYEQEVTEPFGMMKVVGDVARAVTSGVFQASFNRGIAEKSSWMNIVNNEITVELRFDAYQSTLTDVMEPIMDLMLLSAPRGAALTSSGETSNARSLGVIGIDEYWRAPPEISIMLGNILFFPKCVIKSVTPTWSTKLDEFFRPLSATVQLTFINVHPMGFGDLTNAFYPDTKGSYYYDENDIAPEWRYQ